MKSLHFKKPQIFWRWLADFKGNRNKRYWRIPTMDGEFVGRKLLGINSIGGGNILILAKDIQSALYISEIGVGEINNLENVIAPFQGS